MYQILYKIHLCNMQMKAFSPDLPTIWQAHKIDLEMDNCMSTQYVTPHSYFGLLLHLGAQQVYTPAQCQRPGKASQDEAFLNQWLSTLKLFSFVFTTTLCNCSRSEHRYLCLNSSLSIPQKGTIQMVEVISEHQQNGHPKNSIHVCTYEIQLTPSLLKATS